MTREEILPRQYRLRSSVAELEEAFKTEASKVWSKHRTADTEVVAEQTRTEPAEHTPRIAKLEGDTRTYGQVGLLGAS